MLILAGYANLDRICWSKRGMMIWAGYADMDRTTKKQARTFRKARGGVGQYMLIWIGYAHLGRILLSGRYMLIWDGYAYLGKIG